jgi:hypothetical protein
MYRITVFIFTLLCFHTSSFAQEGNYWQNAYGSLSSMLSGAVVGSVADNSAVYYNPGGLGFVQNSSLSISANAYQMDIYRFESPVPEGVNLNSLQVIALPLMVSGIIQAKKLSRHYFGYAIITRNQSKIRIDERLDKDLPNGIPEVPNVLLKYNGQFNYHFTNYELWAGFAYAYRPHPHVSLGVTTFVGYRNTNSDIRVEARVHQQANNFTASHKLGENYLMNHVEMHWRLGISVQYPKFRLGLAVSTPSVSIYGNAKVGRERTILNLNAPGSDELRNVEGFDYQKNLKAEYRLPLSIAFGFGVKLHRRLWLHGTVEYFMAINRYKSITAEPKPFFQTDVGLGELVPDNEWLSMTSVASTIVNQAISLEIIVSPRVTTYIGYRSDNSGLKGQNLNAGFNITPSYARFNIHHITVGMKLRRKKSDLYLGFRFGFSAAKEVLNSVNFTNPSASNLLFGDPVGLKSQIYQPALIVGYTIRSK